MAGGAPDDSAGSGLSAHAPGRVVITGGAGFIGANLCRALRTRWASTDIVVIDDLSTGRRDNLDGVDGVRFIQGSILDAALLGRVVLHGDIVVHLAARPSVPRSLDDPVASHEANASGTLAVLEAARHAGGAHVLVASSSSVYGDDQHLPVREDVAARPMSPYAASKLAAEAYALAYARSFEVPVLVFRFFNVFGPLQRADHAYAAVVPIFASAAIVRQPLPLHGDGRQTRDFTYVDSVTRILVDAVGRRVASPAPVNLAFGGRYSLLELVAALEDVFGRNLELRHDPPRRGDVRDSQADDTRLRALFPGVEPVSFLDGLRATVAWLESSGPGESHTTRYADTGT